MVISTGQAQECPIVEGRVCDPSACSAWGRATLARQIADGYLTIVEGIDPNDKPARSKGRRKFFRQLANIERTLPQQERGLDQCDQYKRGRR